MANDLKTILAKISSDDIALDATGRVIIRNSDIATAIRDLGKTETGLRVAGIDNYGCCKNGIGCGKVVADLL